jgi:hypothetical protein
MNPRLIKIPHPYAHVINAALRWAVPSGAEVSVADLSDAKGVIEEQLEEQAKIFEAPPCPTERFTTDRKVAAYLGFFSYATQKIHREFIGNSSPSVLMKCSNKNIGKRKGKSRCLG